MMLVPCQDLSTACTVESFIFVDYSDKGNLYVCGYLILWYCNVCKTAYKSIENLSFINILFQQWVRPILYMLYDKKAHSSQNVEEKAKQQMKNKYDIQHVQQQSTNTELQTPDHFMDLLQADLKRCRVCYTCTFKLFLRQHHYIDIVNFTYMV